MSRGPNYKPSLPGSWWNLRRCAGLPTSLFFPTQGEDSQQAIAVCNLCPVRAACLRYALDNGEQWGVWGGTSERQRRRLRLAERRAA